MKLNKFWKSVLTFGLYTLWAGFKKKNPANDYTLVVETLLASRAGTPMTRAQLTAVLYAEMDAKKMTPDERDLALALLNKKLDKLGI